MIPPELARFEGLTHLDLSNNGIKMIPEWISDLPNLTVNFNGNPVQQTSSKKEKLEGIDILGNELRKSIPDLPQGAASIRGWLAKAENQPEIAKITELYLS